jgi:hypothetical protein
VTVKVDERGAYSQRTGRVVDTDVARNIWEVKRLDRMVDEAKERLRDEGNESQNTEWKQSSVREVLRVPFSWAPGCAGCSRCVRDFLVSRPDYEVSASVHYPGHTG